MAGKKQAKCSGINNDEVISLVERNPTLYDKRFKDHRDIDVINNIWTSIANSLNVSTSKAKTRWRSLKDKYKRKKENLKKAEKVVLAPPTYRNQNGPGLSPLCSWMIIWRMIALTATCQEQDDLHSDDKQTSPLQEQVELMRKKHSMSVSPSSAPPKKKQVKQKSNNKESSQIVSVLKESRERNQERQEQQDKIFASVLNKDHDSDGLFMMSNAAQLSQLSESSKSMVKIKIAQVFHEATFGSDVHNQSYYPQQEGTFEY